MGGGCGGGRWWVHNVVVGVAFDRIAVVIEMATFWVVGEEVFEEKGFGGRVFATGTVFVRAVRLARVGDAATEAAAEGARIMTLVLGVGVWVDRVVVIEVGGGGRRGGVPLQDRFSWTDEGGCGGGAVCRRRRRCSGKWCWFRLGGGGHERSDLIAAERAEEVVFIVNFLGGGN